MVRSSTNTYAFTTNAFGNFKNLENIENIH